MQKGLVIAALIGAPLLTHAALTVVTFDDLPLTGPDTYWNGSDASGGFAQYDVFFNNSYQADWGIWQGFAYSNVNDPHTSGYFNQYAAISGTDQSGHGQYAVIYDGQDQAHLTLTAPTQIHGFHINNATYTALSMRDGDPFAKQFTTDDWFRLTIQGFNALNQSQGTIAYYLADFRSPDPNDHYILTDWAWVDLTALGLDVTHLTFHLDSSDNDIYGMRTPAYFVMDNFTYAQIPEPGTGLLLLSGLALLRLCARRK